MSAKAASSCTLRLLGAPGILLDGEVCAFRRKTRAILAYLAAANRAHQRRSLAELFCQSARDPTGALRWYLSRIRRQIGAEAILVEGDCVRLNHPAIWVDCIAFQDALEHNLADAVPDVLQEIVALYRGEFLAGMALPESPEFELWLLGRRAHFGALYERSLLALVSGLIAAERYAEAITWAQGLIQHNPLLEDAHGRLVWLYAHTGHRQAAFQQFERCRDLLRTELAVEPSPELQALHAALLSSQKLTPYVSAVVNLTEALPRPAAFVGREAELTRLSQTWEQVGSQRGRLVLLEAEAGGGKTRLANEFVACLPEVRFLSGECYESAQTLPYHAWIELLEKRLLDLDEGALGQLSPLWRTYLLRLLPVGTSFVKRTNGKDTANHKGRKVNNLPRDW